VLIRRPPVNVFAPERTSVPVPSLVRPKLVPEMMPPTVRAFVELLLQVWFAARANLALPVLTAPAPETTSMPIFTPPVETPLSVIVFEPLPKVRAPLLEPMYSFPKAALAVALGALVYVALLKLPVNVALGVVLGVQLVFVPIAVALLFQSADVCARA